MRPDLMCIALCRHHTRHRADRRVRPAVRWFGTAPHPPRSARPASQRLVPRCTPIAAGLRAAVLRNAEHW